MVQKWGMAKDDLYFRLRLPEELKKRVQEAAEASHRSMTAEIIARLERSFTDDRFQYPAVFQPAVSSTQVARNDPSRELLESIREVVREEIAKHAPSPKDD
jgi:Arc-like DNA binding domain.